MDLHIRENENREQYIWRMCQAKDFGSLDMDWDELAKTLNRELYRDESDYMGESAYRKPYQQAKKFYEARAFDTDTEYLDKIQKQQEELKIIKQQVSDERSALNRKLREESRAQEDLNCLRTLIQEKARTALPSFEKPNINSEDDMIICLSDLHFGLDVQSNFGTYNAEIASQRIQEYLDDIISIQSDIHCKDAYILLLGDIISGDIHFTTQLENREDAIEQIQKGTELVTNFVYILSKYFEKVYVNGVSGNHSRISYKDQVLRGERLENITPWYMKAALEHVNNIEFIDKDNYDATIGVITVRGKKYLLVHGDYDSFSESGVSKLVLMTGEKPTGIFYGHLHTCSYDDIYEVKIIRSGCFSGTGDDYCVSKRIYGRPSQMVVIANSAGIKSLYPIEL